MLKKLGFVVGTAAAGMVVFGGMASAAPIDGLGDGLGGGLLGGYDQHGQAGLVNLNNTDVLHNTNVNAGVCGNDVNVLGVQVPIRDSLDGIGVPILSPGKHEAESVSPSNCAASAVVDGGSLQGN